MGTEPRRPWRAVRGVLGGVLGLAVEALAVGLAIVAALVVAALVLWAV
jgi:hypothetical protein